MPTLMPPHATRPSASPRWPVSIPAAAPAAAPRCHSPLACRPGARSLILASLAAATLTLAADPALAQAAGGGGDITTFLQNLVNIITGTTGRLLAVLAICIVGVGALLGALSMRTVGGVLLGVMLIFSSAWLVDQIIGA